MEGNAKSCLADHGEVVGAVANGNGLCQIDLLDLCNELEELSLALSIDNLADIATGEFSVVTDF